MAVIQSWQRGGPKWNELGEMGREPGLSGAGAKEVAGLATRVSKKGTKKSVGAASRSKTATFRPSRSKPALIRKMIRTIEERLAKDGIRATLGDFIRLLQLEKELGNQKPKEIRVKWVEPDGAESASET